MRTNHSPQSTVAALHAWRCGREGSASPVPHCSRSGVPTAARPMGSAARRALAEWCRERGLTDRRCARAFCACVLRRAGGLSEAERQLDAEARVDDQQAHHGRAKEGVLRVTAGGRGGQAFLGRERQTRGRGLTAKRRDMRSRGASRAVPRRCSPPCGSRGSRQKRLGARKGCRAVKPGMRGGAHERSSRRGPSDAWRARGTHNPHKQGA